MFKKFFQGLLILSTLFITMNTPSLHSQEVAENVRVPEWIEFHNTQQKLVEENQRLLGELTEVRNSIRQININLLSWQTATQDAIAGREVKCDILKTKYDSRVETTVIVFSLIGLCSIINYIGSLLTKKKDGV